MSENSANEAKATRPHTQPIQMGATEQQPLPRVVLTLSVLVLALPVLATLILPDLAEQDYGPFLWLTALIPVFAMAYYRGLKGGAVTWVAGVVALSLTQGIVVVLDLATPNWPALFLVVAISFGVSLGCSVLSALLHRDRLMAQQAALADPLTRLPNRRAAELALDRDFAAASRGRKLGVVLWDLDHFKQFNDRHGHAVGDEVLRAFGAVLRKNTRQQNLSARYGGEEFISMVSDVDLHGVLIHANRVREEVKAMEFKWGTITVSVGVAMHRKGMGSYEVLVAAADRALYHAKERGRDRVEFARDEARPSRVSVALAGAPLRQKRILVVDHDHEVRYSLVKLLQQSGYTAQEASGPEEAAQLLYSGTELIDLLVTSVMMRRVSGFTLVDQLSEAAPALRVVYLSEKMRERVSWAGVPGSVTRFVPKPIDDEQLLATVKEVLEASAEGAPDPSEPDVTADEPVLRRQTTPLRRTRGS